MSAINSIFNSSLRVRIPPSPTGQLHLGTARTALYNLILARKYGGKFIFRLEDTDRERSKGEYVDDIIAGFKWLGIDWDIGPLRQSEHIHRHKLVIEQLVSIGKAYECFCSAQELEEIRLSQRAQNKVEGYDNRHRHLTEVERLEFREAGRKPVIRFRLPDLAQISWEDLVRGKMTVNTSDLGGDPVIAKENGDVLYNFAVVVDDHDSAINCVLRGEDHLHNTAKQIPVYEALGWEVPHFGHVPLILTATREKLSKRKHGDIASIAIYREQGYLPEAIANYLVAMSWPYEGGEVFDLDKRVIAAFELSAVSKSPAIYDPQKLQWFCREHFKRLGAEEILRRAKPFLIDGGIELESYTNAEWLKIITLVKDGLTKLSELSDQVKIFTREPDYSCLSEDEYALLQVHETLGILEHCLDILPSTPPNLVLGQLSEVTGLKKGKKLFQPIRLALTGVSHGPDLSTTIEILGTERVAKRLTKALEFIKGIV
ncbi:MAG: glutamate--tRNA ligase [Candidatus Caenarcaniphilales bacterium]|nr:glutamate--tRNA ligase [Candidatus Caenarcaniphilales bacterium]